MNNPDLIIGGIFLWFLVVIALVVLRIVVNYKLWSKIANSINTDSRTLIKIIGFLFCPLLVSLIVYVIVRKDT